MEAQKAKQKVSGPMRFLCLVLLPSMFLSGCSTVVSETPLGEPVPAEEAKKFEGAWINGEDELVFVKHVQGNELRMGVIEWDNSAFKASQSAVFITEDEGRQYGNLEESPEPHDKPTYQFACLLTPSTEEVILMPAHVERFAKAVKNGKLSGTISKRFDIQTVRLNSSAEELSEFVDAAKLAEQFDVENLTVLRRVQRFAEKSR